VVFIFRQVLYLGHFIWVIASGAKQPAQVSGNVWIHVQVASSFLLAMTRISYLSQLFSGKSSSFNPAHRA